MGGRCDTERAGCRRLRLRRTLGTGRKCVACGSLLSAGHRRCPAMVQSGSGCVRKTRRASGGSVVKADQRRAAVQGMDGDAGGLSGRTMSFHRQAAGTFYGDHFFEIALEQADAHTDFPARRVRLHIDQGALQCAMPPGEETAGGQWAMRTRCSRCAGSPLPWNRDIMEGEWVVHSQCVECRDVGKVRWAVRRAWMRPDGAGSRGTRSRDAKRPFREWPPVCRWVARPMRRVGAPASGPTGRQRPAFHGGTRAGGVPAPEAMSLPEGMGREALIAASPSSVRALLAIQLGLRAGSQVSVSRPHECRTFPTATKKPPFGGFVVRSGVSLVGGAGIEPATLAV